MPIASYVGHFSQRVGTGTQNVTTCDDGSGTALPDLSNAAYDGTWLLIAFDAGARNTASGVLFQEIINIFGMASNYGGTVQQFCTSIASQDGNAVSAKVRRHTDAKFITGHKNNGATIQEEGSLVGMVSGGGFQINWTTNDSDAARYSFMLITGLTWCKVVNKAMNATVTGLPGSADLVICNAIDQPSATLPYDAASAYWSLGAFNKHGQQVSQSVFMADGVNPSNTTRQAASDACINFCNINDTSVGEAQFGKMTADGWTWAQTIGYYGFFAAMKGISSKIFTYALRGSSPQTDEWMPDPSFTPRGAITMQTGDSNGPVQNPAAPHADFMLGATDGSHHRLVGFCDRDAMTTTQVDSFWQNDASMGNWTGHGGPTWAPGTVGSFTDTTQVTTQASMSTGNEVFEILFGDDGYDTVPNVSFDAATTNIKATGVSTQRKALTLSDRRTQFRVVAETTTNARFEYSLDNGKNWLDYGADIAGWLNGSIASYVDAGGVERIVAAWKQTGTGGGRTTAQLYIMVGSLNAARTVLTWGTAVDWPVASTVDDYPVVAAQASGSGGAAMMVSSSLYAGAQSVRCYVFGISGNTPTYNAQTGSDGGTSYGGATHMYPAICLDSNGRYHIFLSAGTTGSGKGLRYRTAAWTPGSGWGAQSEVEIDTTVYVPDANFWIRSLWDPSSNKILVAAYLYTGSLLKMHLSESSNFTSFTNLLNTTVTRAVDGLDNGSAALDESTGDVVFFGHIIATWQAYVFRRKWTRSGASLGSVVRIDSGGANWVGFEELGISAWYSSGIRAIWTRGNNTVYGIAYWQLGVRIASISKKLSGISRRRRRMR